MIQQAMDRSRELFGTDFHCAESVLLAATEALEIEDALIPRVSTAFCSGLSRTGGLCGALSGAVLVLSIALGRDTEDQSVEPCYQAVRETIDAFVRRFGSETCLGLTGCDLATDEGQAQFRAENLGVRCHDLVAAATRLALESIGRASTTQRDPRRQGDCG